MASSSCKPEAAGRGPELTTELEPVREWMAKNQNLFEDIYTGKVHSTRHQIYCKGPPNRRAALLYASVCHSSSLRLEVLEMMGKFLLNLYCPQDMKLFSYVMNVLLPEAAIHLLMEVHQVDYAEAEELFRNTAVTTTKDELSSSTASMFRKERRIAATLIKWSKEIGAKAEELEDTLVLDYSIPTLSQTRTRPELISDDEDSVEELLPEQIPSVSAESESEGVRARGLALARRTRKRGLEKVASCSRPKKQKGTDNAGSIQTNVCKMTRIRGKYVQETELQPIQATKDDTYHMFAVKAASAVGLSPSPNDVVAIFRPSLGTMIQDSDLLYRGSSKPWTLGTFVQKTHKSAEVLKFGVGLVPSTIMTEGTQQNVAQQQSVSSDIGSPLGGPSPSCTGEIKVWYSPVGEDVCQENEKTRSWIWLTTPDVSLTQDTEEIDNKGAFLPELHGFVVSRVQHCFGNRSLPVIEPGPDKMPVAVSTGTSEFRITFQSSPNVVISTQKKAVPLCCVSSKHEQCSYMWSNLENPSQKFPSTPVLHVKERGIYKCTVSYNGRCLESELFTITCKPGFRVYGPLSSEGGGESTSGQRWTMHFTSAELLKATNNFSDDLLLGEGGFGKVYLAKNLRFGTDAAVKVLSHEGEKAVSYKCQQLKSELTALSRFRHPNLVDLMGICTDSTVTALVYEYLARKSLHHNLHEDESILSWDQRSCILKDTCRALTYLHGSDPPLIHQDIKSLNILLDVHYRVKVGDFGFALEIPEPVAGRTLVTAPLIARSSGYAAPEVVNEHRISCKSDVYSYGVVVLETYTGLMAYDRDRSDRSLAIFCEDGLSSLEEFSALADPKLGAVKDMIFKSLLFNIVKKCLSRHSKRLTSSQVMEMWTEYDTE